MNILIEKDKVIIDGVEYIKNQALNVVNASGDIFDKIFEYIIKKEDPLE